MAHLYTYPCIDMILSLKYIYEPCFFSVNVAILFATLYFFLQSLFLKLFHFLRVEMFSLVDISTFSFTSSTTIHCSSEFHSFFNKEKTSAKTETKLYFISSIWDYDHIRRLNGKTGNACGVIQVSKESMLLMILLTYWGRRVSLLKDVMLLKTNII